MEYMTIFVDRFLRAQATPTYRHHTDRDPIASNSFRPRFHWDLTEEAFCVFQERNGFTHRIARHLGSSQEQSQFLSNDLSSMRKADVSSSFLLSSSHPRNPMSPPTQSIQIDASHDP